MEETITVKVTEKHIRDGAKCTENFCAIALAIFDTKKEYNNIKVLGSEFMHINHKWYECIEEDVDRVNIFIKNFDSFIEVKPIEFKIKKV